MPSMAHEALALLFGTPALTEHILRVELGIELPAYSEARVEPADLGDVIPRELRADQLVVFSEQGEPQLAVVIEAQLRPDERKAFTWPSYLVGARARFGCPASVLVVTLDEGTAAWSARPIALGPCGSAVRPLVLGPGAVPVIVEEEQARRCPELAVLSAMAHGRGEAGAKVGKVALGALSSLGAERAALYADVVLSCLGEAALRILEAMMDAGGYKIQSTWARGHFAAGEAKGEAKGKAEGEVRGKAAAVITVLQARGLGVPEELRQRVLSTSDLGELERWLRRAAVVGAAEEIFVSGGD